MKLVKQAAQHPVSVLMVYAAVLTFGLVSFRQLNQELLPDLPLPVVRVITEYEGLPAPEVEALITIPVENALSAVKAVHSIRSVSRDELSAVRVDFNWGVDQQKAAVEIREKIDALYPYLPLGCAKPLVFTVEDASARPVLTLAVVPMSGRRIENISEIVRGELGARLQQVPGVATLRIVGLAEPEIKIDVDGNKLGAAGVPLQRVARAVVSSVYSAPLGTIVEGPREYRVEATTDVDTLEEIRGIPIVTGGHGVVPIGQFSRVYWGVKEPTSFFHHNGREAIGIFIEKSPESGSLNTARNLRNSLKHLAPLFAGDLELQVIDDPTEEIERGIRNLLLAIVIGGLAVFAILLILFRTIAVPLVVSASIPASMMVVFLFMKFAGIDLNIISLSGIAIGIGMIVDNSIVVVDSLHHSRANEAQGIAAAAGKTTPAIVGSTATTLLVFLPVVFIPGVTGALFRDLALTISCLLIASLLCALTLTPALYRLTLGRRQQSLRQQGTTGRIRMIYLRYLQKELTRPLAAPLLMVALVLSGAFAGVVLPKRILPYTEIRRLAIRVSFPAVTPVPTARAASQRLASELLSIDRVESVFAAAGYDHRSLSDRSEPERDPRIVHFQVALALKAGRFTEPVVTRIEGILDELPGIHYTISRPTDSVRRLLGDTEVLEYRLTGSDRDALVDKAGSIVNRLEASGMISSALIDTRREANRIEFDLNLVDLASLHAEPLFVLESLRTAVRGHVGAGLPVGGKRIDIRVRLDPDQTDAGHQLERIRVPVDKGLVETGFFGSFETTHSYHNLYRIDRSPAVSVSVHPLPGARSQVAALLSSDPTDRAELLSDSALRQNQRHIIVVFAFALLLMYLLIGAQFESFLLPLVLLLSLLPALSGSLIVLLLCGFSLNLNSFLGILILTGTAINISIILTVGFEPTTRIDRDRLLLVCGRRLKPIAATVLSTVVAMIPIAVNNTGEGALQSNTAVALMGGLVIGMISILFVFPVLYERFAGALRNRQ